MSSALSVETGLSNGTIAYLKAKISKLNERERIVSVILDEVYTSKQIEFVGGKLTGVDKDQATSTLLCIMIKSIGGGT